ncbi:SPOR domain-containing protein [Streptomyces sp. ISL-14]|nr:SPOR domain-containing protein [Bacillus sp. ISL-4]MBT2672674.1 SPOR domain-containing protein [Streptomyces sp. ISL-14]
MKEEAKPVEKKSVLHRVQVGAFSDKKNAENLATELKKKGYSTIIV